MVQHADVTRTANVQLCSVQHFDLPELLHGISHEQVDVHLKLYEGYVNALNGLRKLEADLLVDDEKNALALDGVRRRMGYEFGGARLHELYFAQWERGPKVLDSGSELGQALASRFGSVPAWEEAFRAIGATRGIGWVVLYYDCDSELLLNAWVDEHHVGQFAGAPIVLAMDMWEHAYMVDYVPSEKSEYVGAFFRNLNWDVMAARFEELR